MSKEIEFEILTKNMRFDQLMSDAIRSGEFRRARNISIRRHKTIRKMLTKLIEKQECQKK